MVKDYEIMSHLEEQQHKFEVTQATSEVTLGRALAISEVSSSEPRAWRF